jgi:ATP-binding cassette subfamily F protein uup
MSLVSLHQVGLSFGHRALYQSLSLSVNEGDRIGIIGANGVGKSSLLRLITGDETPDCGTVARRKDLRIAQVPQNPSFPPSSTAEDVVLEELARMDARAGSDPLDPTVRASTILSRLGFVDVGRPAGELSGGWLKRLALAVCLVQEPELLLLDEPTNHLDLEGVLWLEQWLAGSRITCIVITHDRAFLEAVATRVVEIGREYPDGLLVSEGGYSRFLERRSEYLAARSRAAESLENRVRNEVEWLRRGPKARTTKAKGRIDMAHNLIAELDEMKAQAVKGSTSIAFSGTGRRTRRLMVARGLTKTRGGRLLFQNLDLLLKPGLRLGLLGENGSGKTTLLKVLAGQLEADEGEVLRAEGLRVVWFDQKREILDPELLLRKALCEDGDSVVFEGRSIHVEGWARRFGFESYQLETPVRHLSGGELAKVHIARLMRTEADVLLLDEPTNDLDLPTLEVLESALQAFPGAVVLVTHDRYLLDQVSSALLGLDGRGVASLVADLDQWREVLERSRKPAAQPEGKRADPAKPAAGRKRLTYLEQKEYGSIEVRIAEAERALAAANEHLCDPLVASQHLRATEALVRLQQAQTHLDELYARWEYLEAKASG